MIIDKDHILKLADLAKITISEEEIDSYISDINKILYNILNASQY